MHRKIPKRSDWISYCLPSGCQCYWWKQKKIRVFQKQYFLFANTFQIYWYIGCKYIRDVKRSKQKRNKLPWTQNTRSIMCGTLKEKASSQFLCKFYGNHWQGNTFGGIPRLESVGAEEIKGFIRRGLNGDNSERVSALNRVRDEFESRPKGCKIHPSS